MHAYTFIIDYLCYVVGIYLYYICMCFMYYAYVFLHDFPSPFELSCNFLLSPIFSSALVVQIGTSDYSPWRMRGTDDWALAILVVAGQESLWPSGASSLKKHNRVLSEALPKGWASCPQGQEWQLWLGLSSWTFFPGCLGRFCFQFNIISELYPLPPNSWGAGDRDATFWTQYMFLG